MADVTYCGNCGNALTAQDRFCGSCGTPVGDAATPTSPVTMAPVTAPVTAPVARAQDLPEPSLPTAGVASPVAPTAATKLNLNRRLVIAVVASVGVIAVIASGIALGVGIGSASSNSAGESVPDTTEFVVDETVDESEGETDSGAVAESAPSPAPDQQSAAPVEFTSQSGNIRCRMAADGVVCHQGEHTYAKPSQACKSGPKGVTVGLNQSGITWPCLSSDISTSYKLPYDTIVTAHGYDCIITYLTGVTCTNQDLYGFQMEYDLGVKSVQY